MAGEWPWCDRVPAKGRENLPKRVSPLPVICAEGKSDLAIMEQTGLQINSSKVDFPYDFVQNA